MDFLETAKQYEEDVRQWRRDIHRLPEIGFELPHTSKKVADLLHDFGLKVETAFVPGAVLGILDTGRAGNTVALRADMDALEMQELNEVDYRSTIDGRCHACGHDSHTAILLGVAKLVSEHRDYFNGVIKFVFQPAEEGPPPGGAKLICESGVLDDVDYMIGGHAQPLYPAGYIALRHDEAFASGDFFEIKITGQGCHAASPHRGKDVIVTAAQVITALQTIRSRDLPPLKAGVVSVSSVNAGQLAAKNVLPEAVTLGGTYRGYDEDLRQLTGQRIEEISDCIARMNGCKSEYTPIPMFPALVNNNQVIDILIEVGIQVLGQDKVIMKPEPEMGSEDFAYYTHKTKAAFFFFGVRSDDKDVVNTLHSPRFNIDENAFVPTVAFFAAALKRLTEVS